MCGMNTKQYNIVVDKFADSVYRFILSNIKDEFLAQDIVQDSFERLWLNHENIEFDKAKSFLFKTAYNRMIDNLRHIKIVNEAGKEFLLNTNIQYNQNEQMELSQILNMALLKLNETQRAVVLLRDYEGYTYEEISEITGLSESQVKVYIFRARQNLKNFLVNYKEIMR